MVVEHRKPPAVGADTVNTPIGISSIDLPRAVPFPDGRLNLEATQASLVQTKLRVLGPNEALKGHGA